MRTLGIALIIACVVADMATPLCPGAFRLDPSQSVDGAGSRTSPAVALPLNAQPAPVPHGVQAEFSSLVRPGRHVISAVLTLRWILPRATLSSSGPDVRAPRSSEDG
jgi:hypothetical protein